MNAIIKKDINCITTQFEKCVICNIETDVPVNEHIDFRKNYIEGGGQFCEQCYIDLDTKKYIKL
jgi:hypothetical protein